MCTFSYADDPFKHMWIKSKPVIGLPMTNNTTCLLLIVLIMSTSAVSTAVHGNK